MPHLMISFSDLPVSSERTAPSSTRSLDSLIKVEISPESLLILAETQAGGRQAFTFIAQSFKEKADLFSEIFGIEPELTEMVEGLS